MATHHSPPESRKTSPHPGDTMTAVLQRRYGSADTLTVGETPVPAIGPDEVLVEVHAAGVDRGVWHLMTGQPYLVRLAGYGLLRPKNPVPGLDVSGRVVAIGEAVTRFAVGDAVFGIARGAYAQYAAAPESKLAHKPQSLSFEQAAVASISGITALQALTDKGDLRAGQSVLVIGASGGVGSYAVQLAKALGAQVTGVASAAKAELVRSLGATEVLDYETDDYLDGTRTYDLIVDIGGRNPLRRLRSALEPDGTLVVVGGEGGNRLTGGFGRSIRASALSPFVSQRLTMFVAAEDHVWIDRLASHLANGSVVPFVGARHPLADTPTAIGDLEAGRARGKSVIVVRDERP
ncbi:MAG: NAD(P)-dependent alcohol dehydrogenase [Acidimicrobiales bacterium]